MVATAVAMAAELDVRFQTALADHFPAALVNPTELARALGARSQSGSPTLRGRSRASPRRRAGARDGAERSTLPVLGTAPDFTGNQRWFNTPGGKPLTLAGLRGRVVLVDFWTYTCINCIRTLPVPARLGRSATATRA